LKIGTDEPLTPSGAPAAPVPIIEELTDSATPDVTCGPVIFPVMVATDAEPSPVTLGLEIVTLAPRAPALTPEAGTAPEFAE
jgi:hypothetical protein